MMHTSMLRQEELRIFEELISRFDSLSEAEMSAVGVTPEHYSVLPNVDCSTYVYQFLEAKVTVASMPAACMGLPSSVAG